MNLAPRAWPARLWRLAGAALVVVLVAAALLITALRLAIAYVPRNEAKLRTWVERQTHMRFEYDRLDARLRWYGPELVLSDLRVLDQDGTQALFATREGSVGLDLWNFFRTGQFVAGRVRIDRPRVTIVRLPDGRIRLFGQAERPTSKPFDLDRVPAGLLVIEDATVVFRDQTQPRPPLELTHLDAELRRDRDYVRLAGHAELPPSIGSGADFQARLKGSLDSLERLDARLEVESDDVRLTGLAPFLPARFAQPRGGHGRVHAILGLRHGDLENARLDLGLRDVEIALPARTVPPVVAVRISNRRLEQGEGFMPHATVTQEFVDRPAPALPQEARYAVLQGDFRLRQEQRTWTFRAEDLVLGTPRAAPSQSRVAGSWQGHPQTRFALALDVDNLDVATVWPLALAFAPASFDRWAGLAPTGRVRALRLEARRDRAGLAPSFDVQADVAGVAVAAVGHWPGVSGLSMTARGTDRRGELKLRGTTPRLDLPRLFTDPFEFRSAAIDATWRHDDAGWSIETKGASLVHDKGHATADGRLTFGAPAASPELELEARVDGIDVAVVPKFIPFGRLHEKTVAWLDRAFVAGKAGNGRLTWRGPLGKFPFRHGEGEFLASVDIADMTLDYYPGFAPLTRASGHAVFHNQSIAATLASGDVGGLHLADTTFGLSDYHAPVLDIGAKGAGDLGKALAFVQASPLGPHIGDQFMALTGKGPARYDVRLVLPIVSDEVKAEMGDAIPAQDHVVRATLDDAVVSLPALRSPAQKVSGTFDLHNDEVRASLKGNILDGPFELTAAPGKVSRDVPIAVDLAGHGRASGARLPAFIGLPATIRMSGTADWDLRGRLERHAEGGWPLQFDVTSAMTGLGIDAPRPFAKAPPERRSTHVRIDIAGGIPRYDDFTIESGSARARLRFADRNGAWGLDRGLARFDGQPAALPNQPGLLVTGDWPQFDLGEWLALGETSPRPATPGARETRLQDWLGPVDVHLDRATVYGFEFRDVAARLRSSADAWRVAVSGPDAEGQVTVPDDLAHGRPIVLDMTRLYLASTPSVPGTTESTQSDPRTLPAITAHAEDFRWQGRQFGKLDAVISRGPKGLTFDTLNTTAPAFDIAAKGSWTQDATGPRTQVDLRLTSTDFSATARALNYRDAIDAKKAKLNANLAWAGGPAGDVLARMNGTVHVALDDGQLRDIEPGAGRVLGLLSVAQLPRRLALDFSDVTEKGLAFNSVRGDFELRDGNAYTQNLLLKGPAVDIGIVGRTGLAAEDYDQTVVVSGETGGSLAVAGALAGGPVIGAGVLVLSQLFKDQLKGLARAYYHVSGPWSAPTVERISAPTAEAAEAAAATKEGAP